MPATDFIDSNIWIYAHLENSADPRCEQAWHFVQNISGGMISAQVTAEYFNVMRRNAVEENRIQRNIARMLKECSVQPLNKAVIHRTLAIRNRYGFSIWDSQIVAAALEAGCDTLYSEDLQSGQIIESLTVINPLQRDI